MMPKGVEHNYMLGGRAALFGESSDDAERR